MKFANLFFFHLILLIISLNSVFAIKCNKISYNKKPKILLQARESYTQGDFNKAFKQISKYLKKNQNDRYAIKLKAKILTELGNQVQTKGEAEAIISEAAGWLEQVRVLREKKEYKASIPYLDKLIQFDPNNLNHLVMKAAMFFGMGEHRKSITLIRKVLHKQPTRIASYLLIIDNLRELGEFEEALELINDLFATELDRRELLKRKVIILYAMRSYIELEQTIDIFFDEGFKDNSFKKLRIYAISRQ